MTRRRSSDAFAAIVAAGFLLLVAWGNALALFLGSAVALLIGLVFFRGDGRRTALAMLVGAAFAVAFVVAWYLHYR